MAVMRSANSPNVTQAQADPEVRSGKPQRSYTRFETAGRSSGQVRAYRHPGMAWTAGLWHLRRLFSSAEKIFPGFRAQKKI